MPDPPSPIEAVDKSLDVVKKASELTNGTITYSFDKQTKRAKKEPENCECPDPETKRQYFRKITYRHRFFGLPFGFWDQVRLRLGITWEYNGCDVIGAIPYLGSSVARMGWSADVKIVAVDTDQTVTPKCDCCKKAVCVKFQYTVVINPPFQGTRTHSGTVIVCANGDLTHNPIN